MKEIFKDIKNYEGLYQVSNLGRVYSYYKNKILFPGNNKGYLQINLTKDKISKKFFIHRLVAETFIPNPNNLPCVNHIDEDKTNNCVDNLEWCSYKYNINYGSGLQRKIKATNKPVLMLDFNGNIIKEYDSLIIAAKDFGKKCSSGIHIACNNENKTAYGYKWKYK